MAYQAQQPPSTAGTGIVYSRPAPNLSSTAHTIPLARSPVPQYNNRAGQKKRSEQQQLSSTTRSPLSSYLKSSFKIGSTHGRIHFEADERVFHRSDVPQRAREAHEFITQLLHTNLLAPNQRHWDSSISSGPSIRGSHHCSWSTNTESFDDRLYHKLHSEHLVEQAKRRVDLIREGVDPDFDAHNMHDRWNVSTFIPEKRIRPLSATRVQPNPPKQQPKQYKHLPTDYKSLLKMQTELNLYMRELKASAAEQKEAEDDLQRRWASWLREQHIDGAPQHPQLEIKTQPDYE
jgi:hypothetical protein